MNNSTVIMATMPCMTKDGCKEVNVLFPMELKNKIGRYMFTYSLKKIFPELEISDDIPDESYIKMSIINLEQTTIDSNYTRKFTEDIKKELDSLIGF